MTIDIRKTKVHVPRACMEDYSFCVYGRYKGGKTTLFAKLVKALYGSPDKGYLCGFEDGFKALEVKGDLLNEFGDFIDVVNQFVQYKDELDVKLIAIDTIDEMYRQAVQYILKREGRKDGKKYIALNDIAWGKGHEYVEQIIMEQLIKLKKSGYGLFLITHDKDKKFETRDGLSYDKTTLSLPDRIRNSILNMVDFINFIDIAKEKDEKTGLLVDKRYIYFRANGEIEAGSRFENVPNRIDYDVDLFIKTFEEAVKNSYSNDVDIKKIKKEQEVEREEKAKEYIEEAVLPTNDQLVNTIKEKITSVSQEEQVAIMGILSEFKITSLKDPNNIDKKTLMNVIEKIK